MPDQPLPTLAEVAERHRHWAKSWRGTHGHGPGEPARRQQALDAAAWHEAAARQIEALAGQSDAHDKAMEEVLQERDAAEDAVQALAVRLGHHGEYGWSSDGRLPETPAQMCRQIGDLVEEALAGQGREAERVRLAVELVLERYEWASGMFGVPVRLAEAIEALRDALAAPPAKEAMAGQEPDMYWAESNLEEQAESPAEALSEDMIHPDLGELVAFRCAKSLPDEVWQAVAGDDLNTGQPCRCGQRPSCGDGYLEEGCHASHRKVMVRAAPSAEEPG